MAGGVDIADGMTDWWKGDYINPDPSQLSDMQVRSTAITLLSIFTILLHVNTNYVHCHCFVET